MTTTDFLAQFESKATEGGPQGYFLARAYVSWCRAEDRNNCNLAGFNGLTGDDRKLFWEMLHLRERNDVREEQLIELEQRLLKHWRIGKEEAEENTRRAELQTGEDDLDPDDDEFGNDRA